MPVTRQNILDHSGLFLKIEGLVNDAEMRVELDEVEAGDVGTASNIATQLNLIIDALAEVGIVVKVPA